MIAGAATAIGIPTLSSLISGQLSNPKSKVSTSLAYGFGYGLGALAGIAATLAPIAYCANLGELSVKTAVFATPILFSTTCVVLPRAAVFLGKEGGKALASWAEGKKVRSCHPVKFEDDPKLYGETNTPNDLSFLISMFIAFGPSLFTGACFSRRCLGFSE